MSYQTAADLKELGNNAYKAGHFKEAEIFYTRAIQKDPNNPLFFTNRAFMRIKLSNWDACIDDCLQAITLNSSSMKGYYYLSQAQLALKHPNEALSSALTAYEYCLKLQSSSTQAVAELVLRAKKDKWEVKEKERLRLRSSLLAELEERLVRRGKEEVEGIRERMETGHMGQLEGNEEVEEIEVGTKRKVEEIRSVFAIADPENLKRREVPDYMIDNISFGFMHDPVITKSGQSYERSSIVQHLRASQTDPLTREPLRKEDLVPNLGLKQACDEFLAENGWAVDW